MTHHVVLLGATGAVGSNVLATLIGMPSITRITVIARRAPDKPQPAKVNWQIVDPLNAATYQHLLANHDTAICTLGVGQPTQVSREEFQRVDHDAVLAFATACHTSGVKHFHLLGSIAANAKSSNFYLQSKGALRDAIASMGFTSTATFQPSMLITKTNRYDWKQRLMLAVWPAISHLLIGPLNKYRGITVEQLGRAIAMNVGRKKSGHEVLHWQDFNR